MSTAEILEAQSQGYAPATIPAALVQYYNERGQRLTLTSMYAMNIAQRMSEGRAVVMREDIPDPLWEKVKFFFDKPTKWDGELHVADCVLVAQTHENHEFFVNETEKRRKFIEENSNEAAELYQKAQEMLRRAGAPGGQSQTWVDYHPTYGSKVSDHVKGGADLAAEVAAAAAASGKKK